MTAVAVTIQRTPSPRTRPELPDHLVATPAVAIVRDLDDLMSGIACSCSGSDDNPH
ncbi:hypothetical protein [Streptomyces sp. NBC_01262]|uniref:hypothetical protein n=1 Tax=Streptomyces sp. NBC_01262 TaxID=2903803 RepID=UPI002E33B747|nr:hypothetical protein [Streptomyces sp. NBC_01262]